MSGEVAIGADSGWWGNEVHQAGLDDAGKPGELVFWDQEF